MDLLWLFSLLALAASLYAMRFWDRRHAHPRLAAPAHSRRVPERPSRVCQRGYAQRPLLCLRLGQGARSPPERLV